MPRTRGYAAKGERCYGVHDWNAKGRTNVIGAIAHFVFLTLGLFESTIHSDVFYAWLTQDLLPSRPCTFPPVAQGTTNFSDKNA